MKAAPDVIVIGAGIIGLCSATAIARRGLDVLIVGGPRPGEASRAAAGMLAPSVEKSTGPAHRFACAARDFYPSYLEELADTTGIRVPLNRLGVLQVALSERGVTGLRKTASEQAEWIDRPALAEMEPTLSHALGAVLNPEDGAVDNIVLMSALEELAGQDERITRATDSVLRIESRTGGALVSLTSGTTRSAGYVVAAPGAWGSAIEGAPALSAVTPSRGQLLSYDAIGLRHVAYGPRGYLVPRMSGSTVAGATMENVGFASGTTPEGVAKVRSAAEEIAPALAVCTIRSAWAGLRPVTPDMLPLLGPDPENPRIIYACGHSRNGILLAPLTGEMVAGLVTEEPIVHDISQFHPGRFAS